MRAQVHPANKRNGLVLLKMSLSPSQKVASTRARLQGRGPLHRPSIEAACTAPSPHHVGAVEHVCPRKRKSEPPNMPKSIGHAKRGEGQGRSLPTSTNEQDLGRTTSRTHLGTGAAKGGLLSGKIGFPISLTGSASRHGGGLGRSPTTQGSQGFLSPIGQVAPGGTG